MRKGNRVFIGLSTNIGDRHSNLMNSLKRIRAAIGAECIVSSSRIYETLPKYIEEQPVFLNMAAELRTDLGPEALMTELLLIEEGMGRVRSVKNGPRIIDLDIVFYGSEKIDGVVLKVPHPHYRSRDFVLAPLGDLMGRPFIDPVTLESVDVPEESAECHRVLSFPWLSDTGPAVNVTMPFDARFRPGTIVMGIVNISPDSIHGIVESADEAVKQALKMVEAGAAIIDIGGESTNPLKSKDSSVNGEAAEQARVLPAIRALVEALPPHVIVSVDTCRASTAELAAKAGARLINDVSGGSLDPEMYNTVARLGYPYVCTGSEVVFGHSDLKDPAMQGSEKLCAEDICLIRARNAQAAGVCSGNIVIDYGLGFVHSIKRDYEILKPHAGSESEYPVLLGPSRKRFTRFKGSDDGKAMFANDSKEALYRSIAASVLSVQNRSAMIVRTHDVFETISALQLVDRVMCQGA